MDSRRAESFSDGVFAVAITVLVFNLLPVARGAITLPDLTRAWPQYAGYAVSFLTIGIMWLNHHAMFSRVSRVDRLTLVINTFLLMGVVAVPFPTALVADNLAAGTPQASARIAAVVYGLVLTGISVAYSALWMYLDGHRDKLGTTFTKTPRQATIRFSAGLAGYVLGACVGFGFPDVALVIYALIAVYYLFEHLPDAAGDASQANTAVLAVTSAEDQVVEDDRTG